MGITMIMVSALAITLASFLPLIMATQPVSGLSTVAPQTNRTSKEFHNISRSMQDPTVVELRAPTRKFGSDEYNTYTSLTSDVIVETSSSTAVNSKLYPSLTTSAPSFVTRGRYIRNPFYFTKDDQEMEYEDDQHAELLINSGIPKLNRYNINHRHLNKYAPTPIEADITVDEDGSTGYGSTFDFGGSSYGDSGSSYRNPGNSGWSGGNGGGGVDSMVGWFSEPIAQASRPVPIIAEIRHPSHQKMSFDFTKIGMLALAKIAVAKLKALGFIKAMLLVLFKIKLLLLMLAVKLLAMAKFAKLALLPALLSLLAFPMLFSRLTRLQSLLDQPVLVPNNIDNNNNPGDNDNTQKRRRSTLDPIESFDSGVSYFRQIIKSEKCVERVSCLMAGSRHPSPMIVCLNWAVTPVSKYIPSKKIRTFVSTFTEVINYRLDNLYSSLLPSDWKKWCNEHYTCDESKNKSQ